MNVGRLPNTVTVSPPGAVESDDILLAPEWTVAEAWKLVLAAVTGVVAAALADSEPEVATAGFEERVVDDSKEAEERGQLVRSC